MSKSSFENRIPKILLQTSPAPPHCDYIKRMRRHVPDDWQYYHFTDTDIFAFFESNPLEFVPKIRDKFVLMPTGPHKADLFRYFFLYLRGGVFIDSDAILCSDIDVIAKNCSFFSCRSIIEGTIFQGFIGCSPQNEIMKKALVDAYNIDPIQLLDAYHLLCRHLNEIVQSSMNDGVRLYTERPIDSITTDVVDDEGRLLLLHFHQHVRVPRVYSPTLARASYFLCHVNHMDAPQPAVRLAAEFLCTVGRVTKISRLQEAGVFIWKLRFFRAS